MQPGYIIKAVEEKTNVNNPSKKSHKYRLVSHYQGKEVINKQKQTQILKLDGVSGSTERREF